MVLRWIEEHDDNEPAWDDLVAEHRTACEMSDEKAQEIWARIVEAEPLVAKLLIYRKK